MSSTASNLQEQRQGQASSLERITRMLKDMALAIEQLRDDVDELQRDRLAELAGLPNLMSYAQVLKLINLEPLAIKRLREAGQIRAIKVGNSFKYRRDDVVKFLPQKGDDRPGQSAPQTPAKES